MSLPLTQVYEVAEDLLQCVCDGLDRAATEVAGHPGCPCVRCIVPGPSPALDWCASECGNDCGGQLHVGLRRLYPSREFPRIASDSRGADVRKGACPPMVTAAEFTITLARCTPMVDDQGLPPDCAELNDAALTLHVDAAAIMNALHCCVPSIVVNGRQVKYVMGEQTFDVQGGCQVLKQNVIIQLGGCSCPADIPVS